ncbi:hypothetical protein J4423_05425 [Candidatus Pacearchaeota archaeon]|nr:hypothetical protein [Candidatus Pacearchaeota archaeon]
MMFRLMLVVFVIVCSAFLVSSLVELRSPEIIVFTSGQTTTSLGFYNSGNTALFTGEFDRGIVVNLVSSLIQVSENSYGSFSLSIGENMAPGIYFDTLKISRDEIPMFEIPVIIGVESINRVREYDALIKIDPNDLYFIGGDLIVSPDISLFKLNFDPPSSNVVVLKVHFYSINGGLINSSVESIAVSQQATFGRSYNLGAFEQEDLLMAVVAENDGTKGIDLQRINLEEAMGLSLSPPVENDNFPIIIYFSLVALLFGFLILTVLYLLRYSRRRRTNLRFGVVRVR